MMITPPRINKQIQTAVLNIHTYILRPVFVFDKESMLGRGVDISYIFVFLPISFKQFFRKKNLCWIS